MLRFVIRPALGKVQSHIEAGSESGSQEVLYSQLTAMEMGSDVSMLRACARVHAKPSDWLGAIWPDRMPPLD